MLSNKKNSHKMAVVLCAANAKSNIACSCTRVILWTTLRCCSSVFERSIRELKGVKCVYEPFRVAFYHNLGKQCVDPEVGSYEFAEQSLISSYEGYDYVFAKDMAFYIPNEFFSKFAEPGVFQHTFLIRDPRETVPSQWKACVRSDLDFATDIGSGAYGYSRILELLEFIIGTGQDVIVIDAADLLKNPEYIMEFYCSRTGLPYDKKMLTWTPGEVEDWMANKYCKEWHWNAMYSSGFGMPAAPRQDSSPSLDEIPDIVEKKIQESIPYYEAMRKYCVKLP